MKARWFACALVAAGSLGFFAGLGFSEDPAPSEDEMMKMMMELAKPGPQHELLASMAGEWDSQMTSYMKPGEPDVTKGSTTNVMVLGGRYLHQRYDGTYGGMEHHGMGFLGFDNHTKKFQNVWIDNFGTSVSLSEGTCLEDGRTIDLRYTWDGPMGKLDGRLRYTIESKDSHKIEGWMTQGDKEAKTMEVVSTRKGKAAADGPR